MRITSVGTYTGLAEETLMKLLDRGLQRNLLNQLAEHYPEPCQDFSFSVDPHSSEAVNLHYLSEHGLVDLTPGTTVGFLTRSPSGPARNPDKVTITAKGMDFITDDGGLSAILGTVTVRLHADTIRDLIEARISESEAPPAEKRRMVDALKSMPEEGLKQLTTRLIDYGLSQSPNAWQALSNLLS